MLYFRSVKLIPLIAENLYPFTNLYFLYLCPTPLPASHLCTVSYMFDLYVEYFFKLISCVICLSLSYFIYHHALKVHPWLLSFFRQDQSSVLSRVNYLLLLRQAFSVLYSVPHEF